MDSSINMSGNEVRFESNMKKIFENETLLIYKFIDWWCLMSYDMSRNFFFTSESDYTNKSYHLMCIYMHYYIAAVPRDIITY